jgi:hypothetical protein
MKLDAEALRELGRASAAKAEADRLDRQRQAILRTLLQAAAFAADALDEGAANTQAPARREHKRRDHPIGGERQASSMIRIVWIETHVADRLAAMRGAWAGRAMTRPARAPFVGDRSGRASHGCGSVLGH